MTHYYNKRKRNPDYNNNNIIMSEVAAANMIDPPQEFDAPGIPSLRLYFNSLIENGLAEQVKVKWGKSERDVIMIEGKKCPYKGGHDFNKDLGKKIVSLSIYKYVEVKVK